MLTSAVIAAALALIGFVITQSILKFVIEPIQEQRRLTGKVAQALVVYDNVSIDAPPATVATDRDAFARQLEEVDKVTKELRTLAGSLLSSLWSIPGYRVFTLFNAVHAPTNVLRASQELIGWSNNLVGENASETTSRRQQIISEELGIKRKLRKLDEARRLQRR